jgi:Holliday junction resolvase RusA-like endonuclease
MSTITTWPITIEVAGLPPRPNRRTAWQKRRRLVQPLADAVAWQARALGGPHPLERARVQFTLIHTRGRLRDADNAQSSCKELLDALVRGGVLVDDGPDHVELVAIVQVFSAQPGVTIEVWPSGETP